MSSSNQEDFHTVAEEEEESFHTLKEDSSQDEFHTLKGIEELEEDHQFSGRGLLALPTEASCLHDKYCNAHPDPNHLPDHVTVIFWIWFRP